MLTTHDVYGRLAYLNDSGHGPQTFTLIGTGAPLIVVEAMLLSGKSPAEICSVDWLGLHDRVGLVEEVAAIQASLPRTREVA